MFINVTEMLFLMFANFKYKKRRAGDKHFGFGLLLS
jgi:hypothetical protein